MATQPRDLPFFIFTLVVACFVLIGLIVWVWGTFLDKHENEPGRIRAVMFLLLTVITFVELGMTAEGITHAWVAWACLFANVWGGLDAILRFPAAHGAMSFFTLKQFGLLFMKTMAFTFGVVALKHNIPRLLLELFINVWALPVVYLMALPLSKAERVLADNANDVDLVVRIWRLLVCSHERRKCCATWRKWWYRSLAVVSDCSPLARLLICAASPECRRSLSKARMV